jgi:pyridinium-3,5-biscarboxylic acid mononucleotide sulfurtransferase
MRDQPRLDQTGGPLDVAPSIVPDVAAEKERRLGAWLLAQGSVVIGFSGGVDSAYLACVALDALGPDRVLAVIGRSPSYPAEQWETARKVSEQFAIPVREIDTDELSDPNYAANPSNRCFFCKSELWSRVIPLAREAGFAAVVDGTNADDLSDHRPGGVAGAERGVLSPLAIVGFTKAEIRERSRARGVPTWEQPSSPCLASRLPYGTAVTPERLAQVERAERAVRALGVCGEMRVRHHGDLARVELPAADLAQWLVPDAARRLRDAIRDAAGFARVAVDLRGYRTGSLNVLAGVTAA